MPKREIIVIGGSAGSLEGLKTVLRGLADDLAAAVIVVMHLRAREKSYLAQFVTQASSFPVLTAAEGERIEKRKVYVAVPDRHLIVAKGHLHLSRGPKEGLHRPSINATFRSAAAVYGDGVVGVLLSGMLDDGAAGLWEIVRRGGVAIVQDPEEALYPSMPMAALQDVAIQYRLRAAEIGPLLNKIVGGNEVPAVTNKSSQDPFAAGKFSGFTCPECRGPLYESTAGPIGFRCRVGHSFSLPGLLEEGSSTQERKMYEAMVALEEGADMAQLAADQLKHPAGESLSKEAKQLRQHATAIRKLLEERDLPATE